MTAEKINEELSKNASDFNHIIFRYDSEEYRVLMNEEGKLIGAYDANNRFSLPLRTTFSLISTNKEVNRAIPDEQALQIVLDGNKYIDYMNNWRTNYVIETMRKVYALPDDVDVKASNQAISGEEKNVLIAPVELDKFTESVMEEEEKCRKALDELGLTNEQLDNSTIRKVNDYDTDTDEKWFFSMEQDPNSIKKGARLGNLEKWTGGFLTSKIIETLVELVLDNSIEVVSVVKNDDGEFVYGDKITIAAEKPEEEEEVQPISIPNDEDNDDSSNSISTDYLDEKNGDDSDDEQAMRIVEESKANQYHDPDNDDHDDLEVTPISFDGIGGNQSDGLDADTDDEAADLPAADDEVEPADDDADGIENMITRAERIAHEQKDLKEAMTEKLSELRKRKSEVDTAIDDLPIDEVDKINKSIESLKVDRKGYDRQITELRAKKADIDSEIMKARDEIAKYEDQLSHKDELDHEQSELAEQIRSLSDVLNVSE